jgi:hypothetical protein
MRREFEIKRHLDITLLLLEGNFEPPVVAVPQNSTSQVGNPPLDTSPGQAQ